MKNRNWFLPPGLSVSLLILLSACAGKEQVLLPDYFDTQILTDGSKRFSFRLDQNPRAGQGSQRQTGSDQEAGRPNRDENSGTGGRQSVPNREEMEEALEAYFEIYPFCSEGYFIYDQGFDGNSYTMLGECQESASDIEQTTKEGN